MLVNRNPHYEEPLNVKPINQRPTADFYKSQGGTGIQFRVNQ